MVCRKKRLRLAITNKPRPLLLKGDVGGKEHEPRIKAAKDNTMHCGEGNGWERATG